MPLYDYDCADCEQAFEMRVPVAAADTTPCPHCGSAHTRRRLARVALHMQGSSSLHSAYQSSEINTCSTGSCCEVGGTCDVN